MEIFEFEGMKMEEAPPEVVPICPTCKKQLDTIWVKTKKMKLVGRGAGADRVYLCPLCRSFLGYAIKPY